MTHMCFHSEKQDIISCVNQKLFSFKINGRSKKQNVINAFYGERPKPDSS